jgi:hypothetical protein
LVDVVYSNYSKERGNPEMTNRTYYVEDAMSDAFVAAMERLEEAIPCFLELVDIDTVYIECRLEDVKTVERYLTPYV